MTQLACHAHFITSKLTPSFFLPLYSPEDEMEVDAAPVAAPAPASVIAATAAVAASGMEVDVVVAASTAAPSSLSLRQLHNEAVLALGMLGTPLGTPELEDTPAAPAPASQLLAEVQEGLL